MGPYQNAKAYDAYIKKKAIPIEILADIAFLTPMCLASSNFFVCLFLKKKTTPTPKPEHTGNYSFLHCVYS